jgi:SAM-dependent methyltransferase
MDYRNFAVFWRERFLRRRLRQFHKLFPEDRCHTILDVGGTTYMWERLGYHPQVTLLNRDPKELPVPDEASGKYTVLIGDGKALPFPDRSFDLAFCNSVIEHVGGPEDRKQLARELLRVGKGVYCQTPNKWFFIEPHLGTAFLHWLPRNWQHHRLIRYCTLWGIMNRPRPATVARSLSEIDLISRRELAALFPGCTIITERFLFFAKSYIAIRPIPDP